MSECVCVWEREREIVWWCNEMKIAYKITKKWKYRKWVVIIILLVHFFFPSFHFFSSLSHSNVVWIAFQNCCRRMFRAKAYAKYSWKWTLLLFNMPSKMGMVMKKWRDEKKCGLQEKKKGTEDDRAMRPFCISVLNSHDHHRHQWEVSPSFALRFKRKAQRSN